MPIYEYSCPKCGQFEITQRITDDPLKKCPTCKSKVRKLISSTSFQLKGSGWYATDYGGRKEAGKEPAKDGGAGKDAAKESSSGDTAAAAKGSSGESKGKDTSSSSKKESTASAA